MDQIENWALNQNSKQVDSKTRPTIINLNVQLIQAKNYKGTILTKFNQLETKLKVKISLKNLKCINFHSIPIFILFAVDLKAQNIVPFNLIFNTMYR